MQSLILVAWTLLLAAGVPEEAEPGACLLQRGSSDVQRAALVQKGRQEPAHDLGSNSGNNGDAADNSDPSRSSSNEDGKGGSEQSDKKDEEKKTPAQDENVEEEEENEEKQKDEGEKSKQKKDQPQPEDEEKENDEGDKQEKKQDHEETHGDDTGHDGKKSKKGKEDTEKTDEMDEDTPGASLRLELWLPIPIADLKGTKKGPLKVFLETVQTEFATAANVSVKRLDMLGVRGEYTDEGVLSFFARDVKASLQESPVVAEEISHSIVDLEVLPATRAEDPSPQDILRVLREQIGKEDSPLMKGPLKDTLTEARLVIRQGVEGLLPHDKSGATHRDLRSVPLVLVIMALLLSTP